MLQAALDAIRAADIDVEMDAHGVAGQAQGARELIGDISASGSRPRYRAIAAHGPSAQRRRKSRSARSSCDASVRERRAGGRRRRNPRRPGPRPMSCGRARSSRDRDGPAGEPAERRFGIDHRRQRLVIDLDQLGGVLGDRAAIGDDGRDPFADIARILMRQRPACTFGASSRIIASVAAASSSPVTTACTPGSASAAFASMPRMRAKG